MSLTLFSILIIIIFVIGAQLITHFLSNTAETQQRAHNAELAFFASILIASLYILGINHLFYKNMTSNPKEWQYGTYQIEKAVDGTFTYVDIEDKTIKKANLNDNNIVFSQTTSDVPVIYKAKATWGLLEEDVLIYCYPSNKAEAIAYRELVNEQKGNLMNDAIIEKENTITEYALIMLFGITDIIGISVITYIYNIFKDAI